MIKTMIRKVYKPVQIFFDCLSYKFIQDTKEPSLLREIAIVWDIYDVKSIREDLTDEQASLILKHLKKNHDATVGINWDTIEIVADCLFPLDEITRCELLSEEQAV